MTNWIIGIIIIIFSLLIKSMCKAGMKSMREKIQGGNND
jgi:hypothetical protein